jgi:hypothetical protein
MPTRVVTSSSQIYRRYSLLAENSSDEDQGDQPKVKQKRIRKAFEDTSSSSTAPPSESEASSSSLMGQRKKKKKRKQDLEHSVSVREVYFAFLMYLLLRAYVIL